MRELKLVSPIPPSVNHYMSYRAVIRNGKPLAMSYNNKKSVDYKKMFKEYVLSEVKEQGWDLPVTKEQHFYVDAVFYFPRIDMDCNNYWKTMFDAITDAGCIWEDDNVACERVQGIYYDSVNPHIDLTIHPVEYIGVFHDENELSQFVSRCLTCKRYARNCSILRKAKEGRIQEEIKDGVCAKMK